MIRFASLALISALFISCAKEGGGGSSSSGDTITISGTLGITSAKRNSKSINSVSLNDIKMYCVAFNADADSGQSDFNSSGEFEVKEIPADTPFGCFVVQKSDSSIVATLKIEDSNTGMENESSSSMSLKDNVSFGSITLTEGESTISVPKSRVESAQSTKTSTLSVSDLHETEWDLSCVDSDDSQCSDFIADSPRVYFRILEATKNGGKTLNGIGVWASETDFDNCGAKDMTAADASGIQTDEGDGFTWTQNTTGNFVDNHSVCPKRDSGEAVSRDNIEAYYAMEKLVKSGTMFAMNSEDEDDEDSDCYYYHKTAVSFSPQNSTTLYGNFETAEIRTDKTSNGCGGESDDHASFVVKFTKR